ncbi:hypothetical protein HK100_004064 [Physocladia obscura]|uniref:NADPH--hemoprotein reductase n=1 Tax=Physocladia obscura TaxID=109957 RepID=A0AAD5XGT7_9FUNG|nr:hypothetical protein HK100_004064 [Physocladia obscura]
MATTLIIVQAGHEEHFKTDGHSFDVTKYSSLDALRNDTVARFGLGSASIFFRDIHGNPLSSFDEVRTRDIVVIETGASISANSKMADIPGPQASLIFGNLYDILPDPLNQVRNLFRKFGPIIKLATVGPPGVWIADPKDVEIVAEETETFWKRVTGGLAEIKPVGGQGLFTSNTDDPDWILGHKLLIPAFAPKAIRAYSHEMGSLANKTLLVFKEISDSGEKVLINRWMTNFTFETIGKTGFGYDFGLLDSKDAPIHPFITSMAFCLQEGITRARSFKIYKTLPLAANYRYDRELKSMHKIVEEVIKIRKQEIANNQEVPKDFLTYMLTAKMDGKGMNDSLIRDQVMTFLIAGHETTSNTLCWALFEIDRHPNIHKAILQEIVNVGISDDVITDKQVAGLHYIECVLKETLRCHAPVRQIAKLSRRDTNLFGGKYSIPSHTTTVIAIDALHYNPDVFENPDVFDPDRWLPENESKRSVYSWMPFSIGARGCIGRQFAMQEAKIGLAVFLRKFKFTTVDPEAVSYDPGAATTSPINMWMYITPQINLPEPSVPGKAVSELVVENNGNYNTNLKPSNFPLPPITILYGSNTGTSTDYASTIAVKAKKLGWEDVVLSSLDEYLPSLLTRVGQKLASQGPNGLQPSIKHILIVVTSTYNGTPPDNAVKFDKWISSEPIAESQPLAGVHYCVFGCGNKQWRTYQAFPTKVNEGLEKLGGVKFVSAGAGDANEDIDGDFEEFLRSLYSTWIESFGGNVSVTQESKPVVVTDGFTTSTVLPSAPGWNQARREDEFVSSTILVNRELQNTANSKRSTRHIEISVNSEYLPGDHLEVYPQNDADIVEAVAQGFGLALDATFIPTEIDPASLASTRSLIASLPIGVPVTFRNLLTHRADLSGPPTRLIVSLFANKLEANDATAADALRFLISANAKKEFDAFLKKNRTLLDLMNAYPTVNDVSLAEFVGSVSAIIPRRYSIASSPLVLKNRVAIAVGVVKDIDSVSGKVYFGQASGFFKRVAGVENVKLAAVVRSCKDSFRAPTDITVPLIMICAGTGLAPFMGFLQDRKEKGFVVPDAETHLFFGCRNEDDFIYRNELEEYQSTGVLTKIHVAFSRLDKKKYVQNLLIEEGASLWNLLNDRGGKVYVCGAAGGMAKDVRKALEKVVVQIGGITESDASAWLESRYIEDVWG